MNSNKIAFFLPNLAGGGAERVVLNLLKGMSAQDIPLDLVVASTDGPYLEQIPDRVNIVNLNTGGVMKAVPSLSQYLKANRPVVMFSHMKHANVAAILATKLAGTKTKLVVVEHETLSASRSEVLRSKILPTAMKVLYPSADIIVGVSKGVAEDLDTQMGFAPGRVKVVYNPVVDPDLIDRATTLLEHEWFQPGSPPVFLGVGRFTVQKDFLNLIDAFAIVRQKTPARLLILGEGDLRGELEASIERHGIKADVSLPGFVQNPYAYMHNSNAFVLSSRWEGLPTVLIEAMACGCQVVATDCPSGPDEILAAGKYGALVPIENSAALAAAMLQTLEHPIDRNLSIERGMYFSHERAVAEYLKLV
jgi:glycosyltransferase involved in cell wall biosynthesis